MPGAISLGAFNELVYGSDLWSLNSDLWLFILSRRGRQDQWNRRVSELWKRSCGVGQWLWCRGAGCACFGQGSGAGVQDVPVSQWLWCRSAGYACLETCIGQGNPKILLNFYPFTAEGPYLVSWSCDIVPLCER